MVTHYLANTATEELRSWYEREHRRPVRYKWKIM
jgi:hypothetical protein